MQVQNVIVIFMNVTTVHPPATKKGNYDGNTEWRGSQKQIKTFSSRWRSGIWDAVMLMFNKTYFHTADIQATYEQSLVMMNLQRMISVCLWPKCCIMQRSFYITRPVTRELWTPLQGRSCLLLDIWHMLNIVYMHWN